MLNFIKKLQCIKGLKISARTNAFFEILQDDVKHLVEYLALVILFDFNVHVLTCDTGSNILRKNHMFPNPIVLFMYPQPL